LSALVDHGADIRLESKEPMVGAGGGEGGLRRNDSATALDIAEQNGQTEAAGMLKTASEREFERGGLFGEGNAPRKQPSFSGRSKANSGVKIQATGKIRREMERKSFGLLRD
jgi:hypothetical protein